MYSIGQIARKTGLKVPTIRYYEQEKLVSAVGRSAGNQRRFGQAELDRLVFIKHGRELGLSLDDIRELVKLSGDPRQSCATANRIAAEHLISVRDRISKLQALEQELDRIANSCHGKTIGECYVIEALSNHSLCKHNH